MKNLSKFIFIPLLLLAVASCQSPRRHGGGSTRTTPTSNPTSETSATSEGTSVTSEATSATSQGTSTTSQGTSSTSTGTSVTSAGTSATSSTSGDSPIEIDKTELKYDYDDYIANSAWPLDNCPLNGAPKLLIVPVWFSDSGSYISTSKKEDVRSDIQKAYLGTTSETGWHSVKSFYEEESKGSLTLSGKVTEWYNTNKSSSTYQSKNSGAKATTDLVTTVVNWYFSNNTNEKKSDYDTNNDGYLDGVMLIYAHPDWPTYTSQENNFWAYCFWIQQKPGSVSSPVPNVFFWASYDFMYDSSNASSHTGISNAATGDCSHCNVDAHTFIHEMGHVLGLEDYYDYYDTELIPAGGFNMQDQNMGGHDPYSVMGFGWADPYIPTSTTTLTINDFQSSHDLILLSNHTVDSPFDEYILIELYTPTGLNDLDSQYDYANYGHGPQSTGVRIWHVDSRLTPQMSDEETFSENLITNPELANYGCTFAMSNTSNGEYASYLGSKYYKYNLLQFIRNNTSTTYSNCRSMMSDSDLFKAGSTFTWSKYSKQFVSSTMNNGSNFGWAVSVDSISGNQATITVTKG